MCEYLILTRTCDTYWLIFLKRKTAMKRLNVLKVVGGVLVLTAMSSGYAQSSEPEAGTSGQAASMPMASPTHAMPSKAADRALAKRVRRTLAHTKGLNMSGLVVLVKHGRVALTGTVPSSDQIGKAAEVAGSVPGVTGVRNDLTVAVKGH
jgi:hyperosmotically inducible protein